jgi:hypothetical protein
MHDFWPWFHYYAQFPACAINILTLAICNAYWSRQRDFWTREHSNHPEYSGWGTIECVGTIPDWRH